jgi:hypothetical protein
MKTEHWSRQRKDEALKRGSHQSALLHTDFLCEEFVDMIHKGQWVLLPARLVLDENNLQLSPLGVVPQRDWRPRTICDYSFFFVNLDTIPLAPQESMQFGRALRWVLQQVSDADPRLGPVHLSKIDIADGFYRIWIKAEDVPKLGVMSPSEGEPLVPPPLVLPMGWMQSLPLFTAAIETVAGLANHQLRNRLSCGPHRLDSIAETPPPVPPKVHHVTAGQAPTQLPPQPTPTGRPSPPVKSREVYVDEFIGMVQGNHQHRQHDKIVLLHALDSVFRKLDTTDSPHRQEPASIKKMLKGDATWATWKTILGWVVDTIKMTVELPQHRVERLFELLDYVAPGQRRASANKWEKLLGELRSMVLAIPGGRGLFSVLQEAPKKRFDNGTRVRLTPIVHSMLQDFHWLAKDMVRRPTRISELIPARIPATVGAQDTSEVGMGWFHFVPLPNGQVQPLLWWSKFDDRVTSQLATFANLGWTITNSDLKLAVSVAQHDVLAQQVDVREATIHNLTDNMVTMYWQRKGATSTTGPA